MYLTHRGADSSVLSKSCRRGLKRDQPSGSPSSLVCAAGPSILSVPWITHSNAEVSACRNLNPSAILTIESYSDFFDVINLVKFFHLADAIMDVKIYPLDLSSSSILCGLIELLTPYIPLTLPILGTLVQDNTSIAGKIVPADQRPRAWASFPFPQDPPPQIFSIFLLLSFGEQQCRLFCSEDSFPYPPTPYAQAHIMSAMKSFLQILEPKYTKVLPAEGTGANTQRVVMFGSLHEKWAPYLQELSAKNVPYTRYIRASANNINRRSAPAASRDNYLVSQIQEDDVDLIRKASHIARTREYLVSRCPTSVCIRIKNEGGAAAAYRPVAWVLVHSDGSIGTLHVEPDFRRQGLARLAVNELVERSQSHAVENAGDTIYIGGTGGWNWADVSESNSEGAALFGSLEGWEKGRKCYWMFLRVDNATEEIREATS